MTKTTTEQHVSVWGALADTAGEAANLKVRAELMRKIAALVQESGWTQAMAAEQCGVTQPRINDLLRGRISRFSLDALVNIATSLGQQVHVNLEATQRQQQAREYDEFLRRKVEKARTSMHAGQGRSNDEVEDKFAARRTKASGRA